MKTQASKRVVEAVVDYLHDSGQEELIPDVLRDLEKAEQKATGANRAHIASVVKLTTPQLETVKKFVHNHLRLKIPVVSSVDKNLIGGFTLQVGDWFLDASIVHELNILKKSLLG